MKIGGPFVLLLVTAALAGCGGGGGGSAGGTTGGAGKAGTLEDVNAGDDFNAGEQEVGGTAAFRSAFMTCNLYPLSELARQNGVAAKPEAVAAAVAAVETNAKDKKDVHAGCLKGLKQE